MILHTKEDIEQEDKAAGFMSTAWGCEFNRYPQMFVIDWWIGRGNLFVGFAEMKRRYCNHDQYGEAYMSFAKWNALMSVAAATGTKALYIYVYDDCIAYIDVKHVDATRISVKGRTDRDNVKTDIEPMILVPVNDMTRCAYDAA